MTILRCNHNAAITEVNLKKSTHFTILVQWRNYRLSIIILYLSWDNKNITTLFIVLQIFKFICALISYRLINKSYRVNYQLIKKPRKKQ